MRYQYSIENFDGRILEISQENTYRKVCLVTELHQIYCSLYSKVVGPASDVLKGKSFTAFL